MSISRDDLWVTDWIAGSERDRTHDLRRATDADLAALGYVRITSRLLGRLLDGLVGAMMSQVNYEGARRAFQKQLEFALSEQALDGEET